MSDVAISALPSGTTPLTGTEAIPAVQGGSTVQVPASAFGVQGPVSATSGNLAQFGDATGKLIADSGVAAAKVVQSSTSVSIAGLLVSINSTGGNLLVKQVSLGQTPGVTDGSSASAGKVGEYQSVSVSSTAPVSLTSAAPANIGHLSLTAGDWDVWGSVGVSMGASSTASVTAGWISLSSTTYPSPPFSGALAQIPGKVSNSASLVFSAGKIRLSLSSTSETSVYLGVKCTYVGASATGFGFIAARRRR